MRRAAALLVVVLGCLALMGGARRTTYGGGSYGVAGAAYAPGGAPADWDTMVVLFSPEARTDNSPSLPDTFSLPASPTTDDRARVYRLNDIVRGRGAWASTGPADAIYRLGTGFDVPTFAYANLNIGDANGYRYPSGTSIYHYCQLAPINPEGVRCLDMKWPSTNRCAELFYIPFENYIPAGSTIVSASVNVSIAITKAFDYRDTVFCVLDTIAGDSKWMLAKGYSTEVDRAHASWDYQQDTDGGSWTGSQQYPWSPTMANRKYIWDWGAISDWTGTTLSSGSLTDKMQLGIDMTNCVQGAVNGLKNNGILLTYAKYSSFADDWGHYIWDDNVSATTGRTPYVVIKYITKKYKPPFGSASWAFVATTDDGKYPANSAWIDTFLAHGGKYTIYMAQVQVGAGAGAATAAQLVEFHTRGMEVGPHSRWHKTNGLTYWQRTMSMPDTSASTAAWDSLKFDAQPKWIYTLAAGQGFDFRSDPYWGKSMATPENMFSPWVLLALRKMGYQSIRVGYSSQWDREKYYLAATLGAARCDSLVNVPVTQYARHAQPSDGLIPHDTIYDLVGRKANPSNNPAQLDTIKVNMARVIWQLCGQNRRTVGYFWHDVKTNPSGAGYAEGMDPNELGAVLSVVDKYKGRYMTASELAAWRKAYATPVASITRPAVHDTFASTAGSGVWIKPQGVDNRWIRGVK